MRHKQRERGLQTAGKSWRSEGDTQRERKKKQTGHVGEMQFKREVRCRGQIGENSAWAGDMEVAHRRLLAELLSWLSAAG